MRRLRLRPAFAAVLALAWLSLACGGSSAGTQSVKAGVSHGTVRVAGLARTYRLYVPARHGHLPLVVALHPCAPGANGDGQAQYSGMDAKADAGGFVAVYPDGIGNCWNAGGGSPSNPDDVGFVKALLDRLASQLQIDSNRIFATGISGGAALAQRLGCELAQRVRAVASVSGTLAVRCGPARPVSILEIHGTADDNIPYEGGGPFPSTISVMHTWANIDGCSDTPSHAEAGIVQTTTWSGCKGGAVVKLETVTGGHHTWFGCSRSGCAPVAGEPTATDEVWSFFSSL